MLTEAYIEALLVDEELADQVWKLWDVGLIDDELVTITWLLIATLCAYLLYRRDQIRWICLCPMSPDRES